MHGGYFVLCVRQWTNEFIHFKVNFCTLIHDTATLYPSSFHEVISTECSAPVFQVSDYEAVHPMRGWTDLKRRVGPYRRCFMFTHDSMPREPIVVLHTALADTISSSMRGIVTAAQRLSGLYLILHANYKFFWWSEPSIFNNKKSIKNTLQATMTSVNTFFSHFLEF